MNERTIHAGMSSGQEARREIEADPCLAGPGALHSAGVRPFVLTCSGTKKDEVRPIA